MNGEMKGPLPLGEDHLKSMKLKLHQEDEPESSVFALPLIPNPMTWQEKWEEKEKARESTKKNKT